MKRCLVTGGAGFIGQHLCAALRRNGVSVRILDDLSANWIDNPWDRTDLVVGDICDPEAVSAALDDVDTCFHLAAIPSVQQSIESWLASHRTNLTGTVTLFECIRQSGRRIPVVYASSAAVYADPLSAYGADKLACELHARVATAIHRIPTAGLRLFNVYGPGQNPLSPYSSVIPIFCHRIQSGLPVEIHGMGEQSRDFIYVADVVLAMRVAMQRLIEGRLPMKPFDVCTGEATPIMVLAHMIASLVGARHRPRFTNMRRGDVLCSVGDRAAMRAAVGPIPLTKLELGLRETLTALVPP